jgi:hypothetical protein
MSITAYLAGSADTPIPFKFVQDALTHRVSRINYTKPAQDYRISDSSDEMDLENKGISGFHYSRYKPQLFYLSAFHLQPVGLRIINYTNILCWEFISCNIWGFPVILWLRRIGSGSFLKITSENPLFVGILTTIHSILQWLVPNNSSQ